MAEQEIAQHSKNIIGLVTARHHPFAHRVREIAIEIVTIVFAVSMSIWLHGLSEHHHQQQEVRSFLLGLRGDLKADIITLKEMTAAYHRFDANYAYLASLGADKTPDWDRFNEAYASVDSNWYFIPKRNRFDGFTMSGKLSNIEDEALLTDILNLYQTVLPQIRASEHGWEDNQLKLRAYREDGLSTDEPQDQYRLLAAPKGKLLLKHMATYPQHYQRYQQYIDGSAQIIKTIEAAYPGAASAKAHQG